MNCRIVFILLLVITSCSPRIKPYENGPVMGSKDIKETFQPILDFMEYKPGMTFADVGAGSGALTVMMATLMPQSPVYIQDIDSSFLNNRNVDKIIDHYSKESNKDLRTTNTFHITIGGVDHTNLPDATFDRIYSNATVHNFTEIDAMLKDIGKKLKPDGIVFFRDSFKNDHKEGDYCSDPKCARPLLTIDNFLSIMEKNGFVLVKRNPDMSGYPVFGFKIKA